MASKTDKTEASTETKRKTPRTAKAASGSSAAKAATKAKAAPKAARPAKKYPPGPHGKLIAKHKDRKTLVDALVGSLARADQDSGALATTLGKVSNHKLLRLARVADAVKSKYGSRDKLIAAIGATHNKAKDKDFLSKLGGYSLPQLLDLARATSR
jgi:hypothetical protein